MAGRAPPLALAAGRKPNAACGIRDVVTLVRLIRHLGHGLPTMPDWFAPWLLVLDALACYRLTRFIVEDHIPFGPLRERIIDRRPHSLLAEWVTCPWCASVPVAAVVLGLHAIAPAVWPYAAAVLSFAAIAGLLSTWEQRD